MQLKSQYDYIVIGAGSAGCVLAARLSEDPDVSVLLLEAGGSDRSIWVQMPTALSIPMNMSRFDWGYSTEPEPFMNRRRLACPRGRALGGSSSINGMVYVRGNPRDFDLWAEHGASGWDYQHCLPYFRRAERWVGGADDYRGGDGPLQTSNGNGMRNPLYGAFIEAGRQAGYGTTDDYNGYRQEGFGPMHMTVGGGVRSSTSNAYLRGALARSNLAVVTGALAHHLLFDGLRARGVRYARGARLAEAYAEREVIVCAGAIGSPALLQRSGIGPEPVLRRAGVAVRLARDGVGANLQDHLEIYLQFRAQQPITLNGQLGAMSKLAIGLRWLAFKDGLGATNHFESCAFIRSEAGVEWPDIQYHFLPGAMRYDGKAAFAGHGFQVHVGPNKPRSRGRVNIRSADPSAAPSVLFRYLEDPADVRAFRHCVRHTREIMAQPAMDAFRGDEIQPGAACADDAAIDAWIRANAESAYHPSCTCAMGQEGDAGAVVDADCAVIGARALRVVDSSVFPSITNGNLNAPTIMVAERAADLIRGRDLLPPAGVPVWHAPDWHERQRERQPGQLSRR